MRCKFPKKLCTTCDPTKPIFDVNTLRKMIALQKLFNVPSELLFAVIVVDSLNI